MSNLPFDVGEFPYLVARHLEDTLFWKPAHIDNTGIGILPLLQHDSDQKGKGVGTFVEFAERGSPAAKWTLGGRGFAFSTEEVEGRIDKREEKHPGTDSVKIVFGVSWLSLLVSRRGLMSVVAWPSCHPCLSDVPVQQFYLSLSRSTGLSRLQADHRILQMGIDSRLHTRDHSISTLGVSGVSNALSYSVRKGDELDEVGGWELDARVGEPAFKNSRGGEMGHSKVHSVREGNVWDAVEPV